MSTKLIAIAIAAALLPAAAQAAPDAPRTLGIRYGDLDLNSVRDAKVMLHRIRLAAVDVCRTDERTHAAILRSEACRQQAVAEAVSRLRAPRVTAAFDALSVREHWASAN